MTFKEDWGDEIILICFGGLIGSMIMMFVVVAIGNTQYGVLHHLKTDLEYCPHSDYYYNDHMSDCNIFGISPTHPTLNLTGY